MLHDWTGTIDDALGLIVEVSIFTLVFAFGAVLIGSVGAQAMSDYVAHNIAALMPNNVVAGTASQFVTEQAQYEAHKYLQASSTDVVSSRSQCGTAAACVVLNPCSGASPVCVASVERRVTIPVVDSTITWYAKAVSIWPQNA